MSDPIALPPSFYYPSFNQTLPQCTWSEMPSKTYSEMAFDGAKAVGYFALNQGMQIASGFLVHRILYPLKRFFFSVPIVDRLSRQFTGCQSEHEFVRIASKVVITLLGNRYHQIWQQRETLLNQDQPVFDHIVNILKPVNFYFKANEHKPAKVLAVELMDIMFPGVLFEEVLFRFIIQDVLLKKLAKKGVEYISFEYAKKLDSTIYTHIRVLITALAFGAHHLKGPFDWKYKLAQVVTASLSGVLYGYLYEYMGLSAAITMHIGDNFDASKVMVYTIKYNELPTTYPFEFD